METLEEKTYIILNGVDADFHCPSCYQAGKQGNLVSIGLNKHTIDNLIEDEGMIYCLICDNCQRVWELEIKMKEAAV